MVGECALCRTSKRLEYARYGFLICLECEHVVVATNNNVKKAYCRICRRHYSWIWGKYEYDRGFLCLGCINGRACQKCGAPGADRMADYDPGPIWICEADAGNGNGTVEMAERLELKKNRPVC